MSNFDSSIKVMILFNNVANFFFLLQRQAVLLFLLLSTSTSIALCVVVE